MNNLSAILNAYHHQTGFSGTTFLITVVQTAGSTYRKPGARMLVTQSGEMTGMVSGGCLEQDILCRVQQQSSPFVITYDTTTDEDIIWGLGLGCDGVVKVLVEQLESSCTHNPLTFIADCFNRQQSGVLATVFQVSGNVLGPIGTRLMLYSYGAINSNIEDVDLCQAIAIDAQMAWHQQSTIYRQYRLPQGQVDVLLEVIQPPPHLMIFGAGRDALPLAQFAKALGWQLTLVDCRSLTTTPDRFPMADQIILTRGALICQQVKVNSNTMAVVMTHNYLDDLKIVHELLASAAQYIGVLGARQRTAKLLGELSCEFGTSAQFQRLHAPIGLDIGAETPEEIAIAIIAEIQAVIADRPAGFLKHRQASIHPPQSLLVSSLPSELIAAPK
jgi:xanthine dehydrogenase accessory factor